MSEVQNSSVAVDSLCEQARELCEYHDHITRIIANLDIPRETFSDRYTYPKKADFEFEAVIQVFLYQYAREFNQSELCRQLGGAAYVVIRFDFSRSPTQQAINHIWRNRLSLTDRRRIKATAGRIRDLARDHDIIREDEPRIDPDKIDADEIRDEQIIDAVERARERGLDE